MNLKIFLAGSIPKGDNIRKQWMDWKIEYKKILSKINNVQFVDGDAWKDETKPFLLFGHDLNLVKISDIVLVNAEKKIGSGIGVGTAQEIMVAKYFSKPVITILPKNTHHRRSNIEFNGTIIPDWISPFLLSTSDLVVETIHDSLPWLKEYINNPKSKKIKNISIVDDAIAAYYKNHNSSEN
jgi:hypothetical protein